MMSVGSLRRTNSAIARRLSTSSWTFATTSKLVCEPGGTSRLGEILQSLGGSRVMLVTDGGVYGAGLLHTAFFFFVWEFSEIPTGPTVVVLPSYCSARA